MSLPVHPKAGRREYTVRQFVLPRHRLYHDILPLEQMRTPKTTRRAPTTARECTWAAGELGERHGVVGGVRDQQRRRHQGVGHASAGL